MGDIQRQEKGLCFQGQAGRQAHLNGKDNLMLLALVVDLWASEWGKQVLHKLAFCCESKGGLLSSKAVGLNKVVNEDVF